MSTPVYTLRPREIAPEGSQRTGLNATGNAIAAFTFVTGSEASVTTPTATTQPIFGVARHPIPAGQRGNLLAANGRAILLVGATPVAAGQEVMPEANTGCAIPYVASSGNALGGVANTGGTSGQEIEVDLGAGRAS